MPNPNTQLRTLTARRRADRDWMIRDVGREIDRWTRQVERQVLGIVAQSLGGPQGVFWAIDAELDEQLENGAQLLRRSLGQLWRWSWATAAGNIVRAVPMDIWVRRILGAKPIMGTEGVEEALNDAVVLVSKASMTSYDSREVYDWWRSIGRSDNATMQEIAGTLADEIEIQKILNGEATEAEAREIVRKIEFPPPSEIEVEAVLNGTSAHDGMSAMQRIKTVGHADVTRLKQTIRLGMSGGVTGASAVESMARQIRLLVGNDPGKSTGMNYRAKRIARTEGMRVAEAAQRRAWEGVSDLLQGLRAMTAGDLKVRNTHRRWHNVLYVRGPGGIHYKGPSERMEAPEVLPEFPADPNCRCYTIAELRSNLTAGLPPARYTHDTTKTPVWAGVG